MGVLSLLLSGPGLAGLAIAAALAFGAVQSYRLNSCQADAAMHQAQVVIMAEKLRDQNAAVEVLRSEGIRRQAESAVALRKAEARAATWDADAARLRSALTARKPDGPTDCRAAWEALRGGK